MLNSIIVLIFGNIIFIFFRYQVLLFDLHFAWILTFLNTIVAPTKNLDLSWNEITVWWKRLLSVSNPYFFDVGDFFIGNA